MQKIIITNNNFVSPATVLDDCASYINVEFKPNVASISINAFKSWTALYYINIPSTVTTLNKNCFDSCPNLIIVTFFDSSNEVTVDASSFDNCDQLLNITIGRPITSSELPGWINLKNIKITNNNFAAPLSVFSECVSFLNVEFDQQVTSIRDSAFLDWITIESITIPATISLLKSNCFKGCSSLTTVKFSDTVKPIKIESSAFADCDILRTLILGRPILTTSTYPNWSKVNKIILTSDNYTFPNSAFNDCNPFPTIEFGSDVTIIKKGPKMQWSQLTTIEIAEGATPLYIDSGVFTTCEKLTTLIIGRPIYSSDFPGWAKLSNVIVTGNSFAAPFPIFENCDIVPNIKFESTVTTLKSYAFRYWDILTSFTIPASITDIDSGCFLGCTNLVSVTFADSSKPISIEVNAFENCDKLTIIAIGRQIDTDEFPGWKSVNRLVITNENFVCPSQIFDDCTSRTTIEFTQNVRDLRTDMFKFWRNLQWITIPQSVRFINKSCFNSCMNLESVTFSESQNQITMSENAFSGCDRLTTATIGRPISSDDFPGWNNLDQVVITTNYFASPYSVFNGCESFPSIQFDKYVTKIRANAFKSWNVRPILEETNIMENIEQIGSSAFRGTNINTLDLLHCQSLKSIGDYAFAEMMNLESVILPPETSIGVGCFADCPLLADVSLPPYLTQIQDSTFENCEKLKSIPIPPTVNSIGKKSFYGTGIEWVRIGYMVTVNSEAFANCESLDTVELFDYAVIAKNAFQYSDAIKNVVMYEFVAIDRDAFTCRPKMTYFGQSKSCSTKTLNALKKMRVEVIDAAENYIEDTYCEVNVNRVQVNTPSCNVESKCSSAPFYDDYFRQALAIKKSQIKMFCLLHKQNS